MEYDFYHPAVHINQALRELAESHSFDTERLNLCREEAAAELLKKLSATYGKQFYLLGAGIPKNKLDIVVTALKSNVYDDLREKLIDIIKHRRNEYLFNFNWLVLQTDYHNSGLIKSMEILCSFMKKRHKQDYLKSLPCGLEGNWRDIVTKANRILWQEGKNIRDFMKEYKILEDSMLGMDLCAAFFAECGKEGFRDNRELFLKVVESHSCSYINSAFDNYLKHSEELDFRNEINEILLKTYGEPSVESAFWTFVSEGSRQNFCRWRYVKWLEDCLGRDSREFSFWSYYERYIKEYSASGKDKLLFISFENLLAVQPLLQEKDCLLFSGNDCYSRLAGLSVSGLDAFLKGAVQAKEAVLENKFSDTYILSFEGIGKLYAGELMKRELGMKS